MDKITELKDLLRTFASEREWDQFHTPKNLVMALSGEVGELTELFQWLTPEQTEELDDNTKLAVQEEIADILLYLIRLSDKLDIDPVESAFNKLKVNAEKYPVDEAKGNATKYSRRTR